MIKIDIDNAMTLHRLVIDMTGGTSGVRDNALLDSAFNSAFQCFDGIELYPSIEEKAARPWL